LRAQCSQPPSAPIGLTVKTFAADLIRHDLRDIFRCGGAGVPDETLLSSSLSALVHMTESKNKKGTWPSKIAANLVGFLAAMWLLYNQTTSGPA
jgi:hypothetical protein